MVSIYNIANIVVSNLYNLPLAIVAPLCYNIYSERGEEPLRKEVRKMEDMKINLTVDDIITIIEYLNDFKNVVSDCDDDDIAIISNLVDKLRSISL